jgi:peptidylprolyl isomerase
VSAAGAERRRPVALLAAGAVAGALLALAGVAGERDEALAPGAVARVNGAAILAGDYERALGALARDRRAAPSEAERRRVLARLIDEELLVQRALALGLPAADRALRKRLVAAVIETAAAAALEAEPSEAELRALYAAEGGRFARAGRLRVRQIFVRAARGGKDEEGAARARTAAARLAAGEPFEAVRAALGDPEPAPVPDALLKPETLGEYVGPTALRAALALAPGAVSEPVRSASGWHVLRLVERAPAAVPPFEEAAGEVRDAWRRRAGDRALRAYLKELRRAAEIRVRPELG